MTEYHKLINEINNGKLSPIYLIHGDESFYSDKLVQHIIDSVITNDSVDFDLKKIYAKKSNENQEAEVVDFVKRYPLVGEYNLMIVKDSKNLSNDFSLIQSYIENINQKSILVLSFNNSVDKRKKIYKSIFKSGTIFESKKIYENQIYQWIEGESKEKNLNLHPNSIKIIADFVGNDLSQIDNELEKLKLNFDEQMIIRPEEIENISDSNRLVGFPYTKYLNSMIRVNMASSLVLMSEKLCKKLKIPQNKKVYIHGSCVLNDIWNVSKRPTLDESPAIRKCGKEALSQAGISLSEISFLDIYSCFPSAVQIAQKELSLDSNDKRSLTVTGGLPYFGGPGNAYTMFSTSEIVKKLRSNPNEYGMVTANSWFLTKHAINIFSCKPPLEIDWGKDFAGLQKEIDSKEIENLNSKPSGLGKVISYTVVQGRKNLEYGIVIGELEDKSRFVANVLGEESFLKKMTEVEMLETKGEVKHTSERNIFKPLFI